MGKSLRRISSTQMYLVQQSFVECWKYLGLHASASWDTVRTAEAVEAR